MSGGHVQSLVESVVSIAICHRSRRQRFRRARASLVRKTTSFSGRSATTKSSSSHLMATCRLYSMAKVYLAVSARRVDLGTIHKIVFDYLSSLYGASYQPTSEFGHGRGIHQRALTDARHTGRLYRCEVVEESPIYFGASTALSNGASSPSLAVHGPWG
jgi:hypothetical protein